MTKIGDAIKAHIVTLLNANDFVRKVHDSKEGKFISKGCSYVPWHELLDNLFARAGASPPPPIVDTSEGKQQEIKNTGTLDRSLRKRKRPDRLGCSTLEDSLDDSEASLNDIGDHEYQYESEEDENEIDSERGSEDVAAHEESDAIHAIRISHGLGIVSTPFESSVYKQLRRRLMQLNPSEQEKIPQEEIQRCIYLSLDPSHVYSLHNLDESDILNRGLRLLLHQRVNIERERLRLTPHINYWALLTASVAVIDQKLKANAQDIKTASKNVLCSSNV